MFLYAHYNLKTAFDLSHLERLNRALVDRVFDRRLELRVVSAQDRTWTITMLLEETLRGRPMPCGG
jgi:hypothetical protein